ncbi:unnamed protein product [Ectocarpus sp. 12 AP-2014]
MVSPWVVASVGALSVGGAGAFHVPTLPSASATAAAANRRVSRMSTADDKSKSFYPFQRSDAPLTRPGSIPRLEAGGTPTPETKGGTKEGEGAGGAFRQLVGLKGASTTDDILKIRLQLTKPVTWIPLIWGVLCGAAASGNYHWWNPFGGGDVSFDLGSQDLLKALGCMILSGPFLTGYTQTINDWYDRDIDAINEPYRPIPSGAISEKQVIEQIWFLLLGGLAIAYGLDVWAGHDFPMVFALSVGGSFISYIYSAPPIKLKQNGWLGNYALGSSYISLPWWCGQAMFGELNIQARAHLDMSNVVILTLLYSWAGLGIAIVNDFKSVEGDREMGLQSLPVAFGVEKAKWLCVGSIDATQLGIAAWLYYIGEPTYAAILTALVLPQVFAQFKYFLPDPVGNDVKYQATAQPFLVFGILTTALAVGHHTF